jgi:hypothetical protein
MARSWRRRALKVTYVNRSGRLYKPGALLTSINGETVYSSRVSRRGKSHTKSNATKIGGGAGALAGGGKGAAIGAGADAAAEPELLPPPGNRKLLYLRRAS